MEVATDLIDFVILRAVEVDSGGVEGVFRIRDWGGRTVEEGGGGGEATGPAGTRLTE